MRVISAHGHPITSWIIASADPLATSRESTCRKSLQPAEPLTRLVSKENTRAIVYLARWDFRCDRLGYSTVDIGFLRDRFAGRDDQVEPMPPVGLG